MSARPPRLRFGDYLWAGLFFACAGIGAIALVADEPVGSWWGVAIFALCGIWVLWAPGFKPHVDAIQVTDAGVTRRFGPRFRTLQQQMVAWGELTRVEIVTTADGPGAEDFFYLLHASGGVPLVVSNALAVEHGLLEQLQRRLPNMDNLAVATASGSTEHRSFLIWVRDANETSPPNKSLERTPER